jgi:hypothetical protein
MSTLPACLPALTSSCCLMLPPRLLCATTKGFMCHEQSSIHGKIIICHLKYTRSSSDVCVQKIHFTSALKQKLNLPFHQVHNLSVGCESPPSPPKVTPRLRNMSIKAICCRKANPICRVAPHFTAAAAAATCCLSNQET